MTLQQTNTTHEIPFLLVIPIREHQSSGYHSIGLFAIGTNALGNSSGDDVNVFRETPGPQRIKAWKPEDGVG